MKTVLLTLFTFLLFSLQALAFEAGDIAYSKIHQSRVEILGPGQDEGFYHVRLLDGERAGISFDMYAGDNLVPVSVQAPVASVPSYGAEDAQIAASVPLVTPESIQSCSANVSSQAGMDYSYAQQLCAWDSSQIMQGCLISGYQYHTDDSGELVRYCYETLRPQLEQERAQLAAIRQQKITTLITARHAQEIARQNQLRYAQQQSQQQAQNSSLQQQAQQAQLLREMQDQQRTQDSARQIEAKAEEAKADELRREQAQLNFPAPKPAPKQQVVKPAPVKPVTPAVVTPAPKASVVKPAPSNSSTAPATPKKKTDSDGAMLDLPIE